MLYGAGQAAKQEGYSVIVAALTALDRTSVVHAVKRLRDQVVEGVIVIATQATIVRL
jgi:DNA-binding LacI/PurR family transcriptional regulator